MVGPLIVPESLIGFAVPIMLIATLLVYFIIMQQEMTRWEGWLLLLFLRLLHCGTVRVDLKSGTDGGSLDDLQSRRDLAQSHGS